MEEGFRQFLKRGGRSENATRRIVAYVKAFEEHLKEQLGKDLDQADAADLEAFVARIEQEPKASAKGHLWGIRYYYEYTSNEEMCHLAGVLRAQRIERTPFLLKKFRGVDLEHAEMLAAVGIRNVKQMLEAGRTEKDREALSEKTGVPPDVVLELVKLSDLARIPGVKGIRARLYHDAGVDTIAKMAAWDPEELREMVAEFVERKGFEGIAPLPAEARFTVAQARRLPKVVEY